MKLHQQWLTPLRERHGFSSNCLKIFAILLCSLHQEDMPGRGLGICFIFASSYQISGSQKRESATKRKKHEGSDGCKDTSALFYKYVNESGQIIPSASPRLPYNISCEYHKLKQKERINKEASKRSRSH